VYRNKYHVDGSIKHYKPRLVVLGNTQVAREDFHEIFAPVAKMTMVKCLSTVVMAKG